ncbi:hypothetical protein GTU79_05585 [Sodalis ligni]|uniref:hypothetical protein n=1 Tax=Sodalis ligni TaxID=2697027 RepID=UPI00193EE351|nr:hypothetical protein GTU79_05585 [Sodalis ligni]
MYARLSLAQRPGSGIKPSPDAVLCALFFCPRSATSVRGELPTKGHLSRRRYGYRATADDEMHQTARTGQRRYRLCPLAGKKPWVDLTGPALAKDRAY